MKLALKEEHYFVGPEKHYEDWELLEPEEGVPGWCFKCGDLLTARPGLVAAPNWAHETDSPCEYAGSGGKPAFKDPFYRDRWLKYVPKAQANKRVGRLKLDALTYNGGGVKMMSGSVTGKQILHQEQRFLEHDIKLLWLFDCRMPWKYQRVREAAMSLDDQLHNRTHFTKLYWNVHPRLTLGLTGPVEKNKFADMGDFVFQVDQCFDDGVGITLYGWKFAPEQFADSLARVNPNA